jgi:MFS family permease
MRFIFPFQVILIGGTPSLVSTGSLILAIGQLFVFLLLTSLLVSIQSRFLIAGVCTLGTTSLMVWMTDPSIFIWVRLLEGIAYGLYFLAIIKIAMKFAAREGEALGGLFAAVFSGLAIGQALAGIGWQVLEVGFPMLSSLQILQIIAGVEFVLSLVAWGALIPLLPRYEASQPKSSMRAWKLGHLHLLTWLKSFIFLPTVLLLALIYGIYDFAHGFYTPNLSILLNQNGFSTPSISVGYFIADITWGFSQALAGRLIDKIGFSIPLVLSLLFKGVIILFYPEVTLLLMLFVVLLLAGLSEGLLEPARNKAALAFELQNQNYRHMHAHLDLGFTQGTGFILGMHSHEHEHNLQPEDVIGVFKSVGILFFGIGSLVGSWLLTNGLSLTQITQIGGIILGLSALVALLFSIVQSRPGKVS